VHIFGLCGLGLAFGYAVFQYGGILPDDWRISLLAIGCVSLSFWSRPRRRDAPPPLDTLSRGLLAALFFLAVLQVIPLPLAILKIISPARAELLAAAEPFLGTVSTATLSVQPAATVEYIFRLAAYVLVFLMLRDLGWRFRDKPFWPVAPILAIAWLEALLGIVQAHLGGVNAIASGTYPNRNHFAGLLAMTLPFAVAAAVAVYKNGKSKFETPAAPALAACGLLGVGATLLVGILFSLSRMGFLAALGGLLALGVLAVSSGKPGWRTWVPLVALLLVSALAFIFLPTDQLIARFADLAATDDISGDTRSQVWGDTLRLIEAYPVFGCGLGGYESALMRFKSAAPMNAVDYAHNDYLQTAAEFGVPGLLVLLALGGSVISRAVRASARPDSARYIAIACIGAFAAIALHSLVDFNLYIPANAMLLAWIAGLAASL
jgi:O-antigen ligase